MSFIDADGSCYSIDSTEVEHTVQFTLEFHYFFQRALDPSKVKGHKNLAGGKDRTDGAGITNENIALGGPIETATQKYFVTYKFGQGYEGKDLLADMYEYPIEVKIMQVKKATEPSPQEQLSNKTKDAIATSQAQQSLVFNRASLNAITKRLVTLSRTERLSPKTIRKVQSYRNYVLHNYQELPPAIRIRANVHPTKVLLNDLKIPPQPHHSSYLTLTREHHTILEVQEPTAKYAVRNGAASRNSNVQPPTAPTPSSNAASSGTGQPVPTSNAVSINATDVFESFTFKRPKTPPQPHHFDNPDRTVPLEPEVPKKTRTVTEQIVHVGSIFVDPRSFFLGELHAKGILTSKIDGIQDAEVRITLASNLLTPKLEFNLNPMIITISSIENLPENPHSFEHLQKYCQPVYTCFAFADQPPSRHKSHVALPQSRNLYLESNHVILAGLHDEDELYDFCLHSTLNVELHDRDFRIHEQNTYTSQDIHDDLLHSQAHGIAKFKLADLTKGVTRLSLEAPVVPAEILHPSSKVKKLETLPSGFYLESDTRIKIKVRAKNPIFSLACLENAINRGILFFKNSDFTVIEEIFKFIEDYNCNSLGLESIKQLHDYRLSREQRNTMKLDVITGYFISDGECMWLFIEGCLHDGMTMAEKVIKSLDLENNPNVISLFDTEVSYSTRLWLELHSNVTWIHLKTPISKYMNSSKTFLRSHVSKDAFNLLRICYDISTLHAPLNFQVMLNTYLPSFENFLAMRPLASHFSHHIDMKHLLQLHNVGRPIPPTLNPPLILVQESVDAAALLPKLRKLTFKQKASIKKPTVIVLPRERAPLDFSHPIYLYSIQALNTRRQLKKEIFKACKKTGKLHVFPYAPHKTLEMDGV